MAYYTKMIGFVNMCRNKLHKKLFSEIQSHIAIYSKLVFTKMWRMVVKCSTCIYTPPKWEKVCNRVHLMIFYLQSYSTEI